MPKPYWVAVALMCSTTAFAHNRELCERELSSIGAAAGLFAPKQISKTHLSEKAGWEILWNKTREGEVQLLAVQRATLLVRRIDPLTGAILSDKQFLSANSKTPSSSLIQVTPTGELLIAAARATDKAVDLYSDRSDFKITAYLGQDVRHIQLITLNGGNDVFIAASTINTITLFRRAGAKLEKVSFIESQPLIRQLFAFETGAGQIALGYLGTDHKVRLFNWDDQFDELSERPGFVQLGGRLTAQAVNGRVVFFALENVAHGGVTARLVSAGEKVTTQVVNVKPVIGEPLWDTDAAGQASLLIPVRDGARSELLRIDPTSGRSVEAMGLGDARAISDLSQFRLGSKHFHVFTQNGMIVYIQSENETSILPAPARSRIVQTTGAMRLTDGQTAIAVLGHGLQGVSVNVISLGN